jgi:membrane-bound hydrogenase subunit beta
MTDVEIIEKTKNLFAGKVLDIANPAPRRVFLTVEPQNLGAVVEGLKKELGLWHCSTISGVDLGDTFEIVYHFGHDRGNLNIRTKIPRANPHIESITPVIPGAVLYERELQDMFGIVVDHIPDSRPLLVSDDWPSGNYPLRKDWKYERPPEVIPGGKT